MQFQAEETIGQSETRIPKLPKSGILLLLYIDQLETRMHKSVMIFFLIKSK